jgi:hypothetical protein
MPLKALIIPNACKKAALIYDILIGDPGEQQLKKFCDRVWAVKDLVAEDAVIEELFLL